MSVHEWYISFIDGDDAEHWAHIQGTYHDAYNYATHELLSGKGYEFAELHIDSLSDYYCTIDMELLMHFPH